MMATVTPKLSPAKSLRARFSLLMGVSGVVFGFVVTVLLGWQLEIFTLKAQHKLLRTAANELNNRLDKDLRARSREITLAAGLLEKARLNDHAAIRSLLEKLKEEQSSYAWIGLTDATGKVLAATNQQLEGIDVSARPWFAGAKKGALYLEDPHEAVLLSGLLASSPDQEPKRFVDVAIALNDDKGRFDGVLAAHLHWNWVQKSIDQFVRELDSPLPTHFWLANREGRFILVPPGQAEGLASELLRSDVQTGDHLSAASSDSHVGLPAGLGWSIVARQSMDDIMEPIRQVRTRLLLLALVLGTGFLWLTWLVSKRVVQPISEFVELVNNFQPESDKPFRTAANAREDELGVLAKTMDALIEKLRIYAGRNQLFIEHAPVPLAIFDPQMRYLVASRRWLSDYGLQGRNIVGMSHYEIFPDLPSHWRMLHQRGLQGEVLNSPGECFTHDDGVQQWLRWEIRPWHLPDDTIGGIAIFSEDITSRLQAELALQDSERKFRATFEQAAVGIAHVDLSGRWLMVNNRLCSILGYDRNELLEKSFQDITHPDDLLHDMGWVESLLRGEQDHYQMDKRYRHKGGSFFWATLTVALVRKSDGTPDYFVSVVEDVTERKRADLGRAESESRLRLAVEVA
jgi:PAS domain S-box-containing protein